MPNLQETFLGGFYTSTGAVVNIPLTFQPDFFEILNYTQMATTANPGVVVESKWQNGFAAGYAQTITKTNSTNALNGTIATSNGFTQISTEPFQNQTTSPYGNNVAVTAVSTASTPVVSTGSTTGLTAGSTVVQLVNVLGSPQYNGIPFTVGTIVANTSFQLKYAPQLSVAGTTGYYKIRNLTNQWAPGSRYIMSISQATQAVVTFSETHPWVVGDKIQILVGADYGMLQINGKVGTVLAVNTTTNSVTLDINTTGFTAFAFPLAASYPFTFAQAVSVGEIPSIVTGVTANDAINAIQVGTGVGGALNDVMYWRAWKAFEYYPGSLPVYP